MPRVILLLVLIYVLYWLGKRFLWSLQSKRKQSNTTGHQEQKMVRCERCQTHIPESEAEQLNNQWVCKNQTCQK